jgi:predicted  nucleic acid-binding Zn-ribbon protein
MATLADILKAIKELTTITEKIRDDTDDIVKLVEEMRRLKGEMHGLKEEFRAFREESRLSNSEFRGDIKAILNRLDMKEEVAALKVQLAEHIAACEKAKA